ncbi:hypothetical protein Ahy_A09g043590 [Arachis hypogaea]|uniref:SWIM-type domain-containing protein n=1 Tax=Arachis hypogaea TaxID=3818 RepID=A0A445BIW0_ARAHY|nr:hypothetical protein Ahy_A09g043590 [Arachis hypogaea]
MVMWQTGIQRGILIRPSVPFQMASHITFVYHHWGWLEKDDDGVVRYNEGLVSVIDKVHVDTGNLFLVEGLFLDLGYTRYNEVYWLEPEMDLANGLRVLRRDDDVVKLCDAALKNKNRVHLYFEHPVDADPELVDVVEGPPSEDQQNHDQDLPQNDEHGGPDDIVVDGAISEIQATHQDDPTQYEEQQQQEGESVLSNGGNDQSEKGDVGTDNVPIETEAATVENEAPNLGSNHETQAEPEEGQSQRQEAEGRGRKRRKKHGRPQPSGRAQPDAQDNGDELPGRRHHPRPPPSGQKILPLREENQAPRVVVPNQNDPDGGPTEYQYQSEELQTPPGSDSEDENPFKDAVRKYSIQMGREAFFLKVEPHRCRVICYNETCPWEVYCARRNQPPSYQIKTLVDEHTCPRSNRSRSVTCKWWVGDDDHNVFEVRRHGRTLRVNTQERTCTCRKWQLTGLPCCHGIAAIQRKNQRPEDYAHHWLTMEAYNRTYQFHINTVPSQEYWADTEGLPCLPPPYKRPIGRPTKKKSST